MLLTLSLWCLGSGSNELFARSGYYKADPVLSNVASQSPNSLFTANTAFAKYLNGFTVAPPQVNCPNEVSEVADGSCSADLIVTPATNNDPANYPVAQDYPKFQSQITALGEAAAPEINPAANYPMGYQNVPIGKDTIVYKWVNINNSSDVVYCKIPVEVVDNIAPVITCAANYTQNADAGVCYATNVAVVSPTATDLCGSPITYTYAFVDDNGVSHTGPTAAGVALNTINATWRFSLDTTVVTYVATDASGNTATCTTLVVVSDVEAPVLAAAPAGGSFSNDSSLCGKITGFVSPTFTDNCSGAMLTWTIYTESGLTPGYQILEDVIVELSGSGNVDNYLFTRGTHHIVYTVTDAAGLTDSDVTTVTVTDDEAPVLSGCADDVTFSFNTNNNGGNDCIANVHVLKTPATDNCDISTDLIWAYTLFDSMGNPVAVDAMGDAVEGVNNVDVALAKGTYTAVYTVTDLNGNVSPTCTLAIAVVDNEKPQFVSALLPDFVLYNESAGVCYNDTLLSSPNVADNCGSVSLKWVVKDGADTLFFGNGLIPSIQFENGRSTVIWTATDNSGNSIADTVIVDVFDHTNPTINPVANINVTSGIANCSATIGPITVNFGDNCGIDTITENSANLSIQSFNRNTGVATFKGTFPVKATPYNITFTVKDIHGLTSTTSMTVTVSDIIAPTINNFPNIVQGTDQDKCSFTRSFNINTDFNPQDNCAIDETVFEVDLDFNTGNGYEDVRTFSDAGGITEVEFQPGVTNVRVTTTDVNGNSSFDSFTVFIQDDQAPTVFFPDTVTVNIDPTSCTSALVNLILTDGLVSDNCTDDATLLANAINNQTAFGDTATGYYDLGYTTLVWTIADNNGQIATKTVVVYVRDQNLPSDSPNDTLNILSDIGFCSGKVKVFAPNSADSCGIQSVKYSINGAPQVTGTIIDNTAFPVGTNIVEWFTTDNNNNTRIDTAVVIVTDAQAPVFTGPSMITLTAENNCKNDTVITVGVTDNCSLAAGSTQWTLVHFTDASDADGDTISGAGTSVSFNFPSSANNNVITFVAEDVNGNAATKVVNVKVIDNQAPVVNCPGDQTYSADANYCGAQITIAGDNEIIDAPISDNCGIASITAHDNTANVDFDPSDSYAFPIGTTSVTVTVTDVSGNTTVCTFNVTVLNNAGPSVSGFPTDTTVNTLANECSRVVFWNEPTAVDACDGTITSAMITRNYQPGYQFPIGTTTVTYVFTDNSGNSTTKSFTVTVKDVQNPVITPIANQTLYLPTNACTATVLFNPNVQDNCDAQLVTVTATYANGSQLGVGTYNNVVTATDPYGNDTTTTFTITVVDTVKPSFTAFPSDIVTCNPVVNYSVSYTDNCPASLNVATQGPASGTAFPVGTTTVTYTLTDNGGLTASKSFNVTVVAPTTIANAGADASICLTGTNAVANLSGNAAGAGETVTWSTSNAATIASANSATTTATMNTAGIYTFTYTIAGNGTCPPSSDQVIVTVSNPASQANAGIDQTVSDNSTNLMAVAPTSGMGTWTTTGSSVIASPTSNNTGVSNMVNGDNVFIWTVTSGSCPASMDTVVVTVAGASFASTITSAFTPNGDGDNDTYMIPGIANYPNASIEIFNRWGSRVFESTGSEYKNGWNGQFEGKDLPVASYYYVIDLKDGSPVIKGIVSIIR